MAYKIVWTKEATINLEDTIEYLNIAWSEKVIVDFLIVLEKKIQFIERNPYLFRKSNKEFIHELLVTKHNLILYQIDEKVGEISILVMLDTRMNPSKRK